MTETIDNAEVIKDPVDVDQILNQRRIGIGKRAIHQISPARCSTASMAVIARRSMGLSC